MTMIFSPILYRSDPGQPSLERSYSLTSNRSAQLSVSDGKPSSTDTGQGRNSSEPRRTSTGKPCEPDSRDAVLREYIHPDSQMSEEELDHRILDAPAGRKHLPGWAILAVSGILSLALMLSPLSCHDPRSQIEPRPVAAVVGAQW